MNWEGKEVVRETRVELVNGPINSLHDIQDSLNDAFKKISNMNGSDIRIDGLAVITHSTELVYTITYSVYSEYESTSDGFVPTGVYYPKEAYEDFMAQKINGTAE